MPAKWQNVHDTNDFLDYKADWSAVLEPNETILESFWSGPDNAVITDSSIDGNVTIMWLSIKGQPTSYIDFMNKVVTSAGRTYRKVITLDVGPN